MKKALKRRINKKLASLIEEHEKKQRFKHKYTHPQKLRIY